MVEVNKEVVEDKSGLKLSSNVEAKTIVVRDRIDWDHLQPLWIIWDHLGPFEPIRPF